MRRKSVLKTVLVLGALVFHGASAMAFQLEPMPRAPDGRALADDPNAAFSQRESDYMRSFQQQDAYRSALPQRRATTRFLLGGRVSRDDFAARRDDRAPIAPADPQDRTCWDCEQELVDGLWVLKPRRW